MVEMRIVDNGLMCRPDFQYRYMKFAIDPPSGCLCPDYDNDMWSEWKTAPYVKAEEIEND